MSIKEHFLYPLYVEHLKRKKLSKGAFQLYSISRDNFLQFESKYENDVFFKHEQDMILKSILRDDKIETLLDD